MVKFIRYSKIFRLYEAIQPLLKYSPPVESELPGRTVLAVAPHPDDEAIGCGGTLALHAARGGRVAVVYCTTDGEVRKKEAAAAAKVIPGIEPIHLDYPDGDLAGQPDFPRRLGETVAAVKPDIIMVPFVLDNHADHRAVNTALGRLKGFDGMVYAYPVWMPVYPNVIVDISGEPWAAKQKLIGCYKSQLASRDYIRMTRGTGEYWAEVKGRGIAMAEPFFRASFGGYLKLIKRIMG